MNASAPTIPPQQQDTQPGKETEMYPQPVIIAETYVGSAKLLGKTALISGGDSGIGRAVAVHFAREGANIAIIYLNEDEDARQTMQMIEEEGSPALLLRGDVGDIKICREAVEKTVARFGGIDVLVNNAAEQHSVQDIRGLQPKQLEDTFHTNVFGYIYLAQAAAEYLPEDGCIINTGSVTGFRGSKHLLDYAASKGAIQAFTYSLAQQMVERGIRVNGVAPGPVWTPLIPATFPPEAVAKFGKDTPMKRPAQPAEIAPAFVFLASRDASYITGQFIHINGGSYMS